MNQRMIVVKIVEQASEIVGEYLVGMSKRAGAYGEIPSEFSNDIRRFVSALRTYAEAPPVLFFCEYVDMWSGGDIFERWLKSEQSDDLVHFYAGNSHVACYSLPSKTNIAERFNQLDEDSSQEERWFVQTLQNAVQAWDGFYTKGVLVIIRIVTDGSVADDEVVSLRNAVPDWLKDVVRSS